MEDVDVRYAKEHLEDLLKRAARGEDVVIADAGIGKVRLLAANNSERNPPSTPQRRPGSWKGRLNISDDAFLS